MSASAASPSPGSEALDRLEQAVQESLLQTSELTGRLEVAERRVRELDGLLRRISGGELQPSDLLQRMREVEAENKELRSRLERGRDGIERLLARIRFLEEQR